jgi:hypothetical protein
VEYTVADIFYWMSTRTFDAVFVGFWLSHVPLGQFDTFWAMVRTALKPGAVHFLSTAC